MKPAELSRLGMALAPLDTAERRAKYRAGDFPHADRVDDLNKRYRWDLWWSTPWDVRDEIIASFGDYPKDDYIDTALRHLVAPL